MFRVIVQILAAFAEEVLNIGRLLTFLCANWT